jgi:alpha-beta hydrolase superfamily lysophospholipase
MAVESLYRPEFVGDWGAARAVAGGDVGTDTFARPDGISLFFRYWRQPDPTAPVLMLLHGLGAHTGWFIDMGNALHDRGLTVYAVDHRGFGRSGGPRGHVRQGSLMLADIEAWMDEVGRRQPGAPRFILGHSMGGIFAVHVAARDARSGRNELAGVILANPWVRDTSKVTLRLVAQVVGGGLVGSARLVPGGGDTSTMTTKPQAVELLRDDTYWVRDRSRSFLYQIGLQLRSQMLRRAREVRAPALVIQCDADLAVVPAASRQCFEALGSADKTWKTFPEFEHDFEFEPNRAVLDDEIAGWIARRLP